MRVLITGANGFVGSYLANFLKSRDFEVTCAVRLPSRKMKGFQNVIVPNPTASEDWAKALKNIDVVVHLLSRTHNTGERNSNTLHIYREVNVDITNALCDAVLACNSVKRIIYLSSIKVNGEHTPTGEPFNEQSTPNPQDHYGQTKLEAEQLIESKFDASQKDYAIIRPPLIYGKELKGNLLTLQKAVRHGIPLPFACIHNSRSMISLGNLSSFIQCCLTETQASKNTFLVSDNTQLSTGGIVEKIARESNSSPHMFCFPPTLLKALFILLRKKELNEKLLGNLEIDNQFARKTLNWNPDC